MNDEETKEDQSEDTTSTEDAGVQPTTTPLLENADLIRQGLKHENDRTETNIQRLEELEARRQLGGGSEAGQSAAPELSDEEKASRARIKSVADSSGSSWGKEYE